MRETREARGERDEREDKDERGEERRALRLAAISMRCRPNFISWLVYVHGPKRK